MDLEERPCGPGLYPWMPLHHGAASFGGARGGAERVRKFAPTLPTLRSFVHRQPTPFALRSSGALRQPMLLSRAAPTRAAFEDAASMLREQGRSRAGLQQGQQQAETVAGGREEMQDRLFDRRQTRASVEVRDADPTSLTMAAEEGQRYEFGGSYASLYFSLALFLLTLPGLYSLIKRSTKVALKQKDYVVPSADGSTDGGSGRPARQMAGELVAWFKRNGYGDGEPEGDVIVFKGLQQRSKSQAFFLSSCAFLGLASIALVFQTLLPSVGGVEVDAWWYLLTLLSPFAGVYYWENAAVEKEAKVRMIATDDGMTDEITVQAEKDELEQMALQLGLVEKGMVRVQGIFESSSSPDLEQP